MDDWWLLLFLLIFAVIIGVAAENRGRSAIRWFLLSCLITPVLALIALLVMPRGGSEGPQPQAVYTPPPPLDPRKVCPDCGEQVPGVARICRFCRYEFKDMPTPALSGLSGPPASLAAPLADSVLAVPASEAVAQPSQSALATHETFDRYGPFLLVGVSVGLAFAFLGTIGLEPFSGVELQGAAGYALLLVLPLMVVGSLSWIWYHAPRSRVG